MRHTRTEGQDLGGAWGGVFQGWNPTRYKLHCPSDVVVSDIVVEDVLLVYQLLTIKSCKKRNSTYMTLYNFLLVKFTSSIIIQ